MNPSSTSDTLDLDPALRRALQAKANRGRDWARANRDQIERAISRDLAGFVRLAWPILEPTTDLKWGRALDAICLHLEAVADGRVKRLLVNCPPGMMKPVDEDALLLLASGERRRLAEIVVGDEVLTHLGRFRRVTAVHEQGELPTLLIKTFSGRELAAAPDHPFLTPDGWKRADALQVGEMVGTPIPVEDPPASDLTPVEARFLGYFVGDGSCTQHGSMLSANLTVFDEALAEDMFACAAELGFTTRWSEARNGRRGRINLSGGIRDWLRARGIAGKSSYTKQVPDCLWAAPSHVVAEFIGAYFACDGTIQGRGEGRSDKLVSITSVSREMLAGVQHLLLRLGIKSRIRERVRPNGTNFTSAEYRFFVLELGGLDDCARFKERIPVRGIKAQRLREWAVRRQRFYEPVLPDEIVAIEPGGFRPCRCLTVEDDRSFTANDIAVHNSLLTGVFFPAWLWGPKGRPSTRVIGSSYSDAYAARDARRMRSLVLSPWYQHLWGDKVKLTRVAETSFANSSTGSRDGVPFSRLTGGRADVLILDDPHSVSEAESEAERERTVRLFRESVTTRLNDPEKTAIVIICQRLHESDIPGVILADDMGYDALILPMRYDPSRRCRTSIGFEDWRERPGQLLFPERFPREVVDRDERLMGAYAAAAQFQQTPSPRGGGLIQVDALRIVKDWPRHARVVRSWDLAATEEGTADDPDYTAGVKVAYQDGRAWIVDVSRGRLSSLAVEQRLKATAILDGHDCAVLIEREGGASGKMTAAHLVTTVLAGYEAREQLPTGSKVARSRTFAAAVEAGNVMLVDGPWVQPFIGELREFPRGSHDDQVDAAAAGFNFLSSEPEFFVI